MKCYKRPADLWYSRPADAGRLSLAVQPAGAGGLLLGVLVACIGVGVLVGWAAGSGAIGALVGSVAGILGGIFAVYRRYRDAF